MENTLSPINIHAKSILDAQADILALQEKIKSLQVNIINDLNVEFAEELQIIKNAILQVFPGSKIKPKTLGFTVQHPSFKTSSPTDVKIEINTMLKSEGIIIKTAGNEFYASTGYDWKYKSIDVNLTKEWMKRVRPSHKEAILMVEC